jgi:hypothetical protein
MPPIERPPTDITPQGFFERWLPEQARAVTAAAPLLVRVLLDGDGGGAWDLRLGPSGLSVTAGAAGAEAEVTVVQTVADWRAIAVGEPGAVNLAPPQARPTDVLFLDPEAQRLVQQVTGTIRFEVTGYNGRTWALTVKLGARPLAADRPDATISVDADTYAAMLARTLPAPQAYFQGKIKISGDMQLAMQLGMALMPRFN